MSVIRNDPTPGGSGGADDVLITHCHASTHLDALCHAWQDGRLYNGHPASEITFSGARRCGVETVGWIISRGVMLDVAALKGVDHLSTDYAITPDDLTAAAKVQNVEIRKGDVILVRTGWYRTYLAGTADLRGAYPGLGRSTCDWVSDLDLVALGADNVAVEIWPPEQPGPLPLHRTILRDLGAYLIEFVNLEELASERAYEFCFLAAPLRITGGVGSPINPLAIV